MTPAPSPQRLWDLPVRLFHWLLVVLVALLWLSGEFGGFDITLDLPWGRDIYLANMDVHALLGESVLALLLFRVAWGFIGSSSARFARFVRGPAAVVAEGRHLLKGGVPDTAGHGPLGAVMIVALLVLLLAQAVTGLFANDDIFFEGPLAGTVSDDWSDTLTSFHHQCFSVLQALILIHIAVVLYYLARGRNLIKPMITGRRHGEGPGAALHFPAPWRSWLCFLAAAAAVYWLVNL